MAAFRDRRDSSSCPILRPGISKDDARRAASVCRVDCRFRPNGSCQCMIVEVGEPVAHAKRRIS